MAEEEGSDFPRHEGDTRWHALVCYSRKAGNKGFAFSMHKHSFPTVLISQSFEAQVARGRLRLAFPFLSRSQHGSRSGNIFRLGP